MATSTLVPVFDLSPEKIVVLAIIALVVLGPERLPAFARKAGHLVSELRRASGSFQDEFRGALVEPRQALSDAAQEMGLSGVPRVPSVRRAITETLAGAIDTTSQASGGPALEPVAADGSPPLPDDPALN